MNTFKNGQTMLGNTPVSVVWVWGNAIRVRIGSEEKYVTVKFIPGESKTIRTTLARIFVKGTESSVQIGVRSSREELKFVSLASDSEENAASLFRRGGEWVRPSHFFLEAADEN